MGPVQPPPPGTRERWAFDLIHTCSLARKLDPPPPPALWEEGGGPRRITRPGRPAELCVVPRAPRLPRLGALGQGSARVRWLATLHHHELQAAELFAWALLAFPRAPRSFRSGLLALAREELEHARLYRAHLLAHGAELVDYPVRDWFWERVPQCRNPAAFVSLMGLGLEGGNLDHGERLAEAFERGGDLAGAAVCRRIAHEEEAHVRFAVRWLRRFAGRVDFDDWRGRLPSPLSPTLFTGRPLARRARARAGLDEAFLARLEAWCAGSGT